MDKKSELVYQIIFGSIIIAGVIFVSFKYMLKGPPFIKILAIGLIASVIYLVVSFIKSKNRRNE